MLLRKLSYGAAIGLAVLISAAGYSCSSNAAPGTPAPGGTSTISFKNDIQPLVTSHCVGCHQGAKAPAGLSLEPSAAYGNLVSAPSSESPLMRVAPGAPDKSYLLNKLQGTQAQAGGSGAQMPYNAPPLSAAQISLIQQWIAAGAPNN